MTATEVLDCGKAGMVSHKAVTYPDALCMEEGILDGMAEN